MGCAIILEDIGIKMGSHQEKFNGVMLRFARNFKGFTLEELAKKTGIRHDHLVEIEEGLCQPTWNEFQSIAVHIDSFQESFYHLETYIKDEPNVAFICGDAIRACNNCGQVADYLCDYPIGEGKTCDMAICRKCRTHVGKYDFCPIHLEISKAISRL